MFWPKFAVVVSHFKLEANCISDCWSFAGPVSRCFCLEHQGKSLKRCLKGMKRAFGPSAREVGNTAARLPCPRGGRRFWPSESEEETKKCEGRITLALLEFIFQLIGGVSATRKTHMPKRTCETKSHRGSNHRPPSTVQNLLVRLQSQ